MLRFVVSSLLFCFISLAVKAQVPLIRAEQLRTGATFTWTYFEQGGQGAAYSTEQYEVSAVEGSFITLILSSRMDFQGQTTLKTTHKIRVDLRKCQGAHQDPQVKSNFLIDLWPVEEGGQYGSRYSMAATAFEEKFNCHGHIRHGRPSAYTTYFTREETVVGDIVGFSKLFQQKRSTDDQLTSFYFLEEPGLQGVAYKKDFNPGSSHHYQMRLVSWSVPLQP
jgi:hypothetical protein